ncbi:pyrroline-5-carboxylate reductase [Peribacillus simplex]|uniref:pyrroline-5-carboxylate reductase n=1 Tax=Peribacillus simplex TaxID=1478 RepID=UPI00366AE8DE
MLTHKKIAFIGAGTMAESIVAGLLKEGLVDPNQIWVTNYSKRARLQKINERYRVNITYDLRELLPDADIVILAMKPKDVTWALEEIQPFTNSDQLFLSLVAGASTTHISKQLKHKAPIIRVSPNTPSAIGESATGLTPGTYATNKDLNIALILFDAIGLAVSVPEKEIDAVTALSGSAPAYIFYLIEALEKAGEEVGLEQELSKKLILQTLYGAALLIKNSSEETCTLYEQVMSPQGVTAAGFEVLKQYRFQESIIEAIKQGTKRSKELGEM